MIRRLAILVLIAFLVGIGGTWLMSRMPVFERDRVAPLDLPPGSIEVVEATYGGNCAAPSGNVTPALIGACSGLERCVYRLQVAKLTDPAPGCGKDFAITWRCVGDAVGERMTEVPPEAGLGSVLVLDCTQAGN